MLLQSALLRRYGFVHGFTMRTGGVSQGSFASLNLARNVGDDSQAVQTNFERVFDTLGVSAETFYEVSQEHGGRVLVAEPGASVLAVRACGADGLVSADVGQAVAVRVADCLPLLLAHPRSGRVAAVHAGWRGCVAGVVLSALEQMRAVGVVASELCAAIGPHIGAAAFEVGQEVAERLEEVGGAAIVDRSGVKPRISLELLVRAQLAEAGVREVENVPGCTLSEPDRFFSYRRDGSRTGRQMAIVVALPADRTAVYGSVC